MMYTLQRLNVVRIVEDEREKAELLKMGFKEVVESEPKVENTEDSNAKTTKRKPKDN